MTNDNRSTTSVANSSGTPATDQGPRLRRTLTLWNLIIIGIVIIQPIAPMGIYGVISNAAGGHVVDNGAHYGVDVSGRFALGIEERAEPLRKIARAYVEADAHDK